MKRKFINKIIFIIAIWLILKLLIPPISLQASEIHQISQNDEVEIKIYAGVYEKSQGRIGLGWVISIQNNLNESINGTINWNWYTFFGKNVGFANSEFILSAHHPETKIKGVEYFHFPYPILRLTITVETVDLIVSRTGIEIGPFIIFDI